MSHSPAIAGQKTRFVTAGSLFDGHDASINIIRRLLQQKGVEVIHLGHNRGVEEIVEAAIQEDVQGIAISSYQGGHVEFFQYMIDLLAKHGAQHIQVFGGGGGTIVPDEIEQLQTYGVRRIYSPEDGRHLGLEGIIDDMLSWTNFSTLEHGAAEVEAGSDRALARRITEVEAGLCSTSEPAPSRGASSVVVGITGTGGAGKSSLTDELISRYVNEFPQHEVCVLCVDPSKKKTGGALLGDRIRMNSVESSRVFMRSLATRESTSELSSAIDESVRVACDAGANLVIVETSGIGQGDAGIVDRVDVSVYVMTPEYGAATQLEKIDMIDFADAVVINKFDKGHAEDALRDVRKQYRRSRNLLDAAVSDESLPVFGTISSQFNDDGVNGLYAYLVSCIQAKRDGSDIGQSGPMQCSSSLRNMIISPERSGYLVEIAAAVRAERDWINAQAVIVGQIDALERAAECVTDDAMRGGLLEERDCFIKSLDERARQALDELDRAMADYSGETLSVKIRDREIVNELRCRTLAGLSIPRVALPRFESRADLFRWWLHESVPGHYPFAAGAFQFRRTDEHPARQFAGEGPPARTNRRFHLLAANSVAKRLSTAFDSVTLYGRDPHERPDIYGKVGESGVSICTLPHMERLFEGFDLLSPTTSVSMTINGPAPVILAMFFNAAINQQVEKHHQEHGCLPTNEERGEISSGVLRAVRGTVQADILKEDQAQNTCIFSTEFSLRMMGDVQEYFIQNGVRNYYSVSISGYHIAEAGANPISQLAFTLSNGFTYVEYYLARGMKIDEFAPNLSFFFSNGLDAEYAVMGRVARRIWARAIKQKYGGSERSQKLKYHIQTSGRSLHAQEVDFNDIRTTLQALLATYDSCNSLHTNAYDEAVTTPTEESVRRALAIQLIINQEFGLSKNENTNQGAFIFDELTELVEEAVLTEFETISRRGGVIGAMESQYQRGKIQEESMLYEHLKHSGELPVVGVNTFLRDSASEDLVIGDLELTRATVEEKDGQISSLRDFQKAHADAMPAALERLQEVARSGENIFAELMETVKVASLGQITDALFAVGGQYRRNM